MKSFTTLAVFAMVAFAPLLALAGDYDATVFQGLGCRGEIDDSADGNVSALMSIEWCLFAKYPHSIPLQDQGTGCRQAGEGASILIEVLEGECQLFTYSEPGCVSRTPSSSAVRAETDGRDGPRPERRRQRGLHLWPDRLTDLCGQRRGRRLLVMGDRVPVSD